MALEVKDYLLNNGFSDVYASDFTDITKDKVISVIAVPGATPQNYLSTSQKALNRDGVQVIVRGDEYNNEEARNRIVNVEDTLHQADIRVGCKKQGNYTYLDQDEDGRPLYRAEFIVYYES